MANNYFKELPPEIQARWRKWSSKGGKAASHTDKVKAGKAAQAALRRRAGLSALRAAGVSANEQTAVTTATTAL